MPSYIFKSRKNKKNTPLTRTLDSVKKFFDYVSDPYVIRLSRGYFDLVRTSIFIKLYNLVSPCIRLLSPAAFCIVPKWTMDSIAPTKNTYLVVEGNQGTHSTILLHKCLCFLAAIVANVGLYALQTGFMCFQK